MKSLFTTDSSEISLRTALAAIALLIIATIAAAAGCDGTIPAPTQHQARAEATAERYLMANHATIAQDTFQHARRHINLPEPAWEQMKQSMLDRPQRAQCTATGQWERERLFCYQSYGAAKPVSAYIQASVYVEMRNAGNAADPEAVSAHVMAQGMYVLHENH